MIRSSRAGLSQSDVIIPVGGKVRWEIVQSAQEDSASLLADAVDPLIRLVSSPDGWDSGRLYPGQSYTRTFDQAGVYTYNDSAGHTATLRVSNIKYIYLPIVKR